MTLTELRNLDPKRVGSWPLLAKTMLILLLCAAVLGAGYYFDTQHQRVALAKAQNEEQGLRRSFEGKQRKAANLEPLKLQLAEMKESFGALLRLLPNKTEIESLLVDISQSGLAAGLEFELFKPSAEKPAEFYAIQPIEIRVTGTYHEFGEFISAVAALPRIVTQHDITITPRSGSGKGKEANVELSMNLVAKTYRYLDDGEINQDSKAGKGRKKRKG